MVKTKYNTINDIIEAMRINCKCGIREMAFDWKDIDTKRLKKRRAIKACKPYGKTKRVSHGFIVRFMY